MNNTYLPLNKLVRFLQYFTDYFCVSVCVKSFVPFFSLDKRLAMALYNFHIHKNKYCIYVKSNNLLFKKCNQTNKKIEDKLISNSNNFFGYCHAGVPEYVVPLQHKNSLFGYISIHGMKGEANTVENHIEKLSKEYGIDLLKLQTFYNESFEGNRSKISPIVENSLALVAEYIEHIYARLKLTSEKQAPFSEEKFNIEIDLLPRILQFINMNHNKKITVKDIAEACNCCSSSINHVFKKNMGMSIPSYINRIRIEKAQLYLRKTRANITEISFELGFNDPNYFTKVFSETIGIPPLKYRESYSLHSYPK